MANSSSGGPRRSPLLLACAAALLLHTPLLWWAREGTPALSRGASRQGMVVVELLRPRPALQQLVQPPVAVPPQGKTAVAPAGPQAWTDATAAASAAPNVNSTPNWMTSAQRQAASIELSYPDAQLPGGQLTLRWWLRLQPDGSVQELRSNASSSNLFVDAAEQALHAAQFNAAALGLASLPNQLCLELRYEEMAAPEDHVRLRRLNVRGGATPCLGIAPPGRSID